jgi:DNA-directed RNA polymerase subunit beta
MLTAKSDDVAGRYRIYDSIAKGKPILETSTPESLNVLTKELQALGLDMQFLLERDIEEIEEEGGRTRLKLKELKKEKVSALDKVKQKFIG